MREHRPKKVKGTTYIVVKQVITNHTLTYLYDVKQIGKWSIFLKTVQRSKIDNDYFDLNFKFVFRNILVYNDN